MAERIRNLQPGEASYSNSLKRPTSEARLRTRNESRETRAERRVIMPTTLRRWRENL